MPQNEDFADFTGGIRNATDGLVDFNEALGSASEAAEDMDFGDLGDGGGEEGEAGRGDAIGMAGEILKGGGGGLGALTKVVAGIAAVGLPLGIGTVLTKAVGSKL